MNKDQRVDETLVDRVVRPTDEKIVKKAVHKHSIIAHEARFLRLAHYTYIDEHGQERQWEICERTTRKGEVDGIEIIAMVQSKTKEPRIILVAQYRPPMCSYCVEFPAGLIDNLETPEEAALRELQEETGYIGKITKSSPILALEPGLTNANTVLVYVDVDEDALENQSPKQNLDENENIEVLLFPIKNLLAQLLEYQNRGCVIDAKLYTFAYALEMGQRVAK